MFEEMMERARMEAENYYRDKIEQLASSNEELSSQVDYLKNLLRQYNIQFD